MKNILNLLITIYFTINFIINFNHDLLNQFYYYLLLDIIYILLYEKENELKFDIIIHHISGIFIILGLNNSKLNNFFQIFTMQEFTTILAISKKICKNVEINKIINNLLFIIWIPLRILLPYYIINYSYIYYYNNKLFIFNIFFSCILYLLNIKWTLLYLFKIKNDHYSYILLFIPIIFMKKDIILFNLFLLQSIISLIYNHINNNNLSLELKNKIREIKNLLLSFDTTIFTLIIIKLNCNLELKELIIICISTFYFKYIYNINELHSFYIITILINKLKNNILLLLLNSIFLSTTFILRHYTRKTFLWNLSCLCGLLTELYINDKLINLT